MFPMQEPEVILAFGIALNTIRARTILNRLPFPQVDCIPTEYLHLIRTVQPSMFTGVTFSALGVPETIKVSWLVARLGAVMVLRSGLSA